MAGPLRTDAATGSISVANVTAGATYQLNTIITFGNGGQAHETLSATAQIETVLEFRCRHLSPTCG